ncbi:MAG: sensor histidine kinase [Myxococcota bacterium]
MDRASDRGLHGWWLPLAVVVAGFAVSSGSWWQLVSERRAQLVAATEEVAGETAAAIELRVGAQVDGLQELAALRARFGSSALGQWEESADLLINARSGLSCIEWIDLDDPSDRQAVGDLAAAGRLPDPATLPRETRPRILGPEANASGGFSYRLLLPVQTATEHSALLVAHVEIDALLAPLLRARAPGYAVGIDWGDVRIFARGRASEPQRSWWRAERSIALSSGARWQVTHEPTAELVAARLTPAPHYLLATGLALSVLLATVARQWRVVARQAGSLGRANLALEERGRGLEQLNLELERRVSERTEQLEEAVSELQAFNHSVSHDLRSPLGAVLNLAAILREDYGDRSLDGEGEAILQRIERAALRASTLLEDLLRLSQAREAALDLGPVDMTALARETFAQVRAALPDDEIELALSPLPEAYGDRDLLGAVLENLFSNAVKYSRGCEKPTVTVTGRLEDDACLYEVADNGRGFDMRFASRLFGLFERLHDDADIEGTGVGLALVARVVKRHGGRVEAWGEPGAGARFSLRLPREPAGPEATRSCET